MSTIDRLVNRIAERARVDAASITAGACATCSPEQRQGMTFVPGDVVVDLITGQKGTIRAGAKDTRLVSPPER